MSNEFNINDEKIEYIKVNYLKKLDKTIAIEIDETESLVRKVRLINGWKKQRQVKGHTELFNEIGEKWCWYCNEYHDVSKFSKNKSKPSGYQDECKTATKEIKLKRMEKNKVQEHNKLTEKKCADCGEVRPIEEFIKSVSTEDGYSNKCKECLNKPNNRFKTDKWNKKDEDALEFLFKKGRQENEISKILNKTEECVNLKLKEMNLITDKCKRCDDNIAETKGKYKGFCIECIKDIKSKEKVERSLKKIDDKNNEIIKDYITKNKDTLKYCDKCGDEKDIYEDYYYSVTVTKEGYTVVNKECKKCAKIRNEVKKINNLKNKGYN